jgi:hypothetical protein
MANIFLRNKPKIRGIMSNNELISINKIDPGFRAGRMPETGTTRACRNRACGTRARQVLRDETLAIRSLDRDGQYGAFFASHQVATIDLTKPKSVGHVSEQPSVMSPD